MRNVIEISNLYKSFGKTKVLVGIDQTFEESKITVILGPNGSGKTTMIKSILGMVIPDKGSIKVLNSNIQNQWSYRDSISYMRQIANFPANLTVKELINMITDIRVSNNTKQLELIKDFGLQSFMKVRLSNLSGGTKQKVNIMLAFMYDSPIMILDEPTNGLDPVALIRLKELIKEKKEAGISLIITTHIMQLVEELADEIIFLLDGNIYFKGTVDSLKNKFEEQDIERAIAKILISNNVV